MADGFDRDRGQSGQVAGLRKKFEFSTTQVLMALLLLTVTGCTGTSATPKPEPADTETPTVTGAPGSATEVRESLSRLDPCQLIAPLHPASQEHPVQGDPHRCTVTTDEGYLSLEIGVPFDKAARAKADNPANRLRALEIGGLRAYQSSYSDSQSCDITFPVGARHGIAIESDDHCSVTKAAATGVAARLQSERPPLRPRSDPQNHTACGLLERAAGGDAKPVDGPGGLSTCSATSESSVDGVRLSITYMDIGLEAFSLEDGERTKIAGKHVFLKSEPAGCVAYTILGKTSAKHASGANVQLSLSGETCDSVTSLIRGAVESWAGRPATEVGLASYLVRVE